MDIESIIVICIALGLPFLTEYRLKKMMKKMLEDPETAKKLAKLIKETLKQYKKA